MRNITFFLLALSVPVLTSTGGCGPVQPDPENVGQVRHSLTTTTVDWSGATVVDGVRTIDVPLPVGPAGGGETSSDYGICGFSHIEGTFAGGVHTVTKIQIIVESGYYHFFGQLDSSLEVPVTKVVCSKLTDFTNLPANVLNTSSKSIESTSGSNTSTTNSTNVCPWAGFRGEMSKPVSSNLNQSWAAATGTGGANIQIGAFDSSATMDAYAWCTPYQLFTWKFTDTNSTWDIDTTATSTGIAASTAMCYLEGIGQNYHVNDLSQHFYADLSIQTIGGNSVWAENIQNDSELRWNCVKYNES